MSWTITSSNLLVDDADALAYLTAVETTDGQALESGVRLAVNAFVKGCKADGIWPALKASCILAGARTRIGALTPLVGAAPTSANFVDADYDRKTGLVGNGSTKYLDTNRNNNADPQDNNHNAVYLSVSPTIGTSLMGTGVTNTGTNSILTGSTRSRHGTAINFSSATTGFLGMSRSLSTTYTNRSGSITLTHSQTSQTPLSGNLFLFARNLSGPSLHSNARLAFYSIGESLDLALLDARVTTLINAIGAAIP